MFTTIWRFTVRPEHAAEFERHYGPDGTWAVLFRRSDAHRGTELLRNTTNANEYVTLDHWSSRDAYENFRDTHANDYRDVDARMEAFTISEEHIGEIVR